MNEISTGSHGRDGADPRDGVESVLADLARLRGAVVDAWMARGLTLHPEERRRLRDEIRSTCELLMTFTATD